MTRKTINPTMPATTTKPMNSNNRMINNSIGPGATKPIIISNVLNVKIVEKPKKTIYDS